MFELLEQALATAILTMYLTGCVPSNDAAYLPKAERPILAAESAPQGIRNFPRVIVPE